MNRRLLTLDRILAGFFLCTVLTGTFAMSTARADERSWTGDISGLGPDAAVTVTLAGGMTRDVFTATVRNTGTAPWGDFHFGIFDPMGGQNIANVDFLDASMGGQDPTSSQSGLAWVINDVVVGATIDLYFCTDPVPPGETAVFSVFFVNPDQITFPGVLFYPTPVPPSGACCHPDGSCTLTCEHDCLVPSTFFPGWTSCLPNPCPQPFGACCFMDGHCEVLIEADCIAAPESLQWIAGGICVPANPCPQPPPTAACCDLAGNCGVTTQANCPPPSSWHPEWVSCVPNYCPPPVPARNTTWGEIKATYR
jgi:hypothetical protein